MTRILLFIDLPGVSSAWLDDDLTPREVMMMINTHQYRPIKRLLPLERRKPSALAMHAEEMVSVNFSKKPVELYPRMYEALFGLADGKPSAQIAEEMGLSEGRLNDLFSEIRSLFYAHSLFDALQMARSYGVV